jgi:hypothetical protein
VEVAMIFALVTFIPYPKEPMSPAMRLELFERTAPNYQKVPGLLRKYYIGEPGKRAGGAYEFDTLTSAKAHFTSEWEKFMTDTYGSDLRVEYFDAPCVVDNTQNTITIEPALRAAAKQHAEAGA